MTETKNSSYLLSAEQMAHFAADGFLIMNDIVPQALNEQVYQDQLDFPEEKKGFHFWENSAAVRQAFDLPEVKGVIESMVGTNPRYNHSFLHVVKPENLLTQCWHIDSGTKNPDPRNFDIQAFYFSHDTPLEMGPTLVLPGSHLRNTSYWDIARYKNILGQRQLASKAGTIVFMHQDIWHCAQANQTKNTRYVFKIRLDPQVQQSNLFHTDGYDSPEILQILKKPQPWSGRDASKDAWQKMRFWRYLTGNAALGRRQRFRE